MLISKIAIEHQKQVSDLEKDFTCQLAEKDKILADLQYKIDLLLSQIAQLQKDNQAISDESAQIKREFYSAQKTHEEEVTLRLQFESKLN